MAKIFVSLLFLFVIFGSGGAVWYLLEGDKQSLMEIELMKFKQQVSSLEQLGAAGDADALYELGVLYETGPKLFRDLKTAADYYNQSARLGNPNAQYAIGRLFEQGKGVPRDDTRAAKWFRVAATVANHREAHFALGQMYFQGRGVMHDYSLAIEHYAKAADRGHVISQYLIGVMYKEGWGVRRDPVEALKWLTLSLDGEAEIVAHSRSFNPARERKALLKQMNPTQINEGERRAEAFAAAS